MSVRSERRRQKSAQRRVAARAAAVSMLADEEKQRRSLDDLLTKSLAIGRHIEIDSRLKELTELTKSLNQRFSKSFAAFEESLSRLVVMQLDGFSDGPIAPTVIHETRSSMAAEASDLLRDAEAAFGESADLYVEMTDLLIQRADLQLGGITRAELETAIEGIATRADSIETGLVRNRTLIDEIRATNERRIHE